ncbi:hypothetical protein QMK19_22990 [Streptomyces sp. H10-C2]|uniref:hypothetical protein n=1 Tax=unclassified Streptomyces TaxID=2593676 RepID=UPI0024BBD6CD|nr:MULTISPECIES: hypothetical protein [unclassified Streptomyces]MDJ0342772.1 hypothetical protein [Streptomyces sp. PH10-H1]MDJ0372450.1 hypothetical protein [Streptomyces sp. H10-C2]
MSWERYDDALDLLAAAIAGRGPVACVVAVPGASDAAQALAARLTVPSHPWAAGDELRDKQDQPPLALTGRVLLFASIIRAHVLETAAADLRAALGPRSRVETATLVLRSRLGPAPNWWAWTITGSPVYFPAHPIPPGMEIRNFPYLPGVHASSTFAGAFASTGCVLEAAPPAVFHEAADATSPT